MYFVHSLLMFVLWFCNTEYAEVHRPDSDYYIFFRFNLCSSSPTVI